jgi:hypothetical protein
MGAVFVCCPGPGCPTCRGRLLPRRAAAASPHLQKWRYCSSAAYISQRSGLLLSPATRASTSSSSRSTSRQRPGRRTCEARREGAARRSQGAGRRCGSGGLGAGALSRLRAARHPAARRGGARGGATSLLCLSTPTPGTLCAPHRTPSLVAKHTTRSRARLRTCARGSEGRPAPRPSDASSRSFDSSTRGQPASASVRRTDWRLDSSWGGRVACIWAAAGEGGSVGARVRRRRRAAALAARAGVRPRRRAPLHPARAHLEAAEHVHERAAEHFRAAPGRGRLQQRVTCGERDLDGLPPRRQRGKLRAREERVRIDLRVSGVGVWVGVGGMV